MHTAPPPLPSQPEVAPESSGESRISSGTWAVAGVILLGVFAAISAWLYRHNLERKPLDFWGFDSHRIIKTAPVIQATLIRPDTLTAPGPTTAGEQVWNDDLFMMLENRYVIEGRADVVDRPEFRLVINNGDRIKQELAERKGSPFPDNFEITNDKQLQAAWDIVAKEKPDEANGELETKVDYGDFDKAISLRAALRANRSYDWQAFPWAEEPQWRYALTFAQKETTLKGTKHELTRTFTFTLVFDVTCRWVTLQSVDKLTALEPSVQDRLRKFFLEVFPGSDKPTVPPPSSAMPTAVPSATPSAPGASPLATGMRLGTDTIIREDSPATGIGVPSLTTTAGGAAPPLQLKASPLLQPSSALPQSTDLTQPPLPGTALPGGNAPLPTLPGPAAPTPTAVPAPSLPAPTAPKP